MSGLDRFIYKIASILGEFISNLSKFKKTIIGLVVFECVGAVVLTAILLSIKHHEIFSKQIEDTNGKDTALCEITDEMIEACATNYDIFGKVTEIKKEDQSGVEGKFAEFDGNEVFFKTKIFTGVFVLNAYLSDENPVAFQVQSEVIKGNARIVLTDEEHRILKDIPVGEESSLTFNTEKGKVYYLKIVGESAECKVKVFRNENA